MNDFDIYPFPVLGGTLALSPLPGRTGAFIADIQQIRRWRPDIVLTLCQLDELIGAGSANLPDEIAASNAVWRHMPVVDFGTPDAAADADWKARSAEIRTCLEADGRILIHCLGGCGRSGMAALRVMVDAGISPGTALETLRQARQCAIETDAQMIWATRGAICNAQ